ncbi:hypothetical protein K469DRAFT_716322 [Zopfia rhizophila CBS 207.26]|uniref:Uncharacterized protein n=1 Tax=Zopfia rhizophila CBS 207.26 TaxID=1314779 RepID=A0A6A6DLR3_9PEZI|nr:hypothetical protein K469DRAFT_716322 [Zopfia rhizophila CBS 207.26]
MSEGENPASLRRLWLADVLGVAFDSIGSSAAATEAQLRVLGVPAKRSLTRVLSSVISSVRLIL